MASSILPISPGAAIPLGSPILRPGETSQPGEFQATFENAINKVEGLRAEAHQSVESFLAGEGEELHGAILATQKANLAFELMLQVRNKVVSAYQEVMRMQM
jgi:flagellar hook-basal body complex protein FliE